MNPLAILYRRVSTDQQDNSLDLQEAVNDEYCRRLLPEADLRVFADPDTSGSIPFAERAGGAAMLAALRQAAAAGRTVHFVTAKQDRMGRDTLDLITTMREIWGLGVLPHFPAEGGAFPRTNQNELLFDIKATVANYELNLIRTRTRDVLRAKFHRHELTGHVPYGYWAEYHFADGHVQCTSTALSFGKRTKVDGHWTDLGPDDTARALLLEHGACMKKILGPNDEEIAVIRDIAAWQRRGLTPDGRRWTLKGVAAWLNAQGIPAKQGGQWQFGTVHSVLHNQHTRRLLREGEAGQQNQRAA